MTHPEGPNFLEVQPPCSMQGSSGAAGSGNGVAEGISEVRDVEFRPPKAPASSTSLGGSISSLHHYTSSELCNPVRHFLSRKHTAGFPLSQGNHTPLLVSRSQRLPGLSCCAGCWMEGAPSSEKNILVPLLDKLGEFLPFVSSKASVWEAVGKVVGLLAEGGEGS